jgi:hypothetical protein
VWPGFPFDVTDKPSVRARLDASLRSRWGGLGIDAVDAILDRIDDSKKRKRGDESE